MKAHKHVFNYAYAVSAGANGSFEPVDVFATSKEAVSNARKILRNSATGTRVVIEVMARCPLCLSPDTQHEDGIPY